MISNFTILPLLFWLLMLYHYYFGYLCLRHVVVVHVKAPVQENVARGLV